MPKHKQAGHTTVLTKMRKQHNKTLAMQVPTTQDIGAYCCIRLFGFFAAVRCHYKYTLD
jgi:hypothetical protein